MNVCSDDVYVRQAVPGRAGSAGSRGRRGPRGRRGSAARGASVASGYSLASSTLHLDTTLCFFQLDADADVSLDSIVSRMQLYS